MTFHEKFTPKRYVKQKINIFPFLVKLNERPIILERIFVNKDEL